jgi:phage host-nuclease inhibitor protein Gam
MARIKKKVFTDVNRENAEGASVLYATCYNQLQKIEAKMNDEINKVKSKFQEDILDLTEKMEEPYQMLQVYAQEQKESWGKKKSADLLHCTIGFRTGTPKVTKDKKFTWDGITEIVSKIFPGLVRNKIELDKDAIISLRDSDEFTAIKEKCYIDVVQDETFFVVPKEEELVPQ